MGLIASLAVWVVLLVVACAPVAAPQSTSKSSTPIAAPKAMSEVDYRRWSGDFLTTGLSALVRIWEAQAWENPVWRSDVRSRAEGMARLRQEIGTVRPAAGFEGVHAALTTTMDFAVVMADAMLAAIRAFEAGDLELSRFARASVNSSFENLERSIKYVNVLMDEKNAGR